MTCRTLTFVTATTLFTALVSSILPAAQEWQQTEDTGNVASTANPVPLINQPLVPEARRPGATGFTLIVNGTGFVAGSVVKWNGSPRATTFVNKSRLTASILSTDVANPGTASVKVVNPSGSSSNVVFFEVTPSTSSIGLSAPKSFTTGSGPALMAVGDFNGDGKPDLAVANEFSNNVSILLGDGHGGFQTHVDYPAGPEPSAVAVGDFNGDGKLDLAVADTNCPNNTCGPGSVSILLGTGDGTFGPPAEYSTGPGTYSLAVGDFNGDGKLDLAVAVSGANGLDPGDIEVLLGNGDGTFQAAVKYGPGAAGGPASIAVGDFNGDGKLDLAAADCGCTGPCGNVSVLLGNGDGTFQPAVNYSAGAQPLSIAAGDFNHDGKLDLALANVSTQNITVLMGNGDGTFQPAVNYGTNDDAFAIAVADLNGDGKPDLIALSSSIFVFLGNGDGTFQGGVTYNGGADLLSLAIGDVNNDGRPDLIVSRFQTPESFLPPVGGGTTVSVLLQTPTVSLSKTSLVFADQVIGTSSTPQTLTFTNTSGLTLNFSSIAISGTNAIDFGQTHSCGSSLRTGASCTLTVTFTPNHVGPRAASLVISDNAMGTPQVIALSGTGVISGPDATLSPTSLTFATQLLGTTSAVQTVKVSNYGTTALNITSIGFTGTNAGDFHQSNTCGSSVAAGASCTVAVTFTPKAINTRTARLSISDNAPGNPQTVSLSGPGTEVELSPRGLQFGCVIPILKSSCSAPSQTVTLTNVGTTVLSISSIKATANPPFSQTNTCGSSVAVGKSCTITVSFDASSAGSYSGAVAVTDNGGGSPQQVSLSGKVTKQHIN
ncbi:MAG TPA: FG-GAP-like repeat-containing protein [Candidatus Sulfotelmatobacter sp.]|nr:FG-GAP-like repeat-containing protein [Candidatus Sulfotelmatobacter sp.]